MQLVPVPLLQPAPRLRTRSALVASADRSFSNFVVAASAEIKRRGCSPRDLSITLRLGRCPKAILGLMLRQAVVRGWQT